MEKSKYLNKFISLFFPQRCPYCNSVILSDEFACAECLKQFPKNAFASYTMGGYKCISSFLYRGIFSNAVKQLKFKNRPQYAPLLAHPLAQQINKEFTGINFDFVTSVPLHKSDHRERGYNQSKLIAKEVANLLNAPYKELLIKIKKNKKQHNLSREQRILNVKNTYKITVDETIIKNKTILICDDIITTGSTLGECARIIKNHKPNAIYCATVCTVYK